LLHCLLDLQHTEGEDFLSPTSNQENGEISLLDQAEINRMAADEDRYVRREAANALGEAFSQVPDKTLAWQDLHRLIKRRLE